MLSLVFRGQNDQYYYDSQYYYYGPVVVVVLAISLMISTYFLIYRSSVFFGNGNTRSCKRPPLPPGPYPWPIIGCLPQMMRMANKYKWVKGLMEEHKTDIICIRIGSVHVISVTSQKLAREFLKEQDAIFASRAQSLGAALISHNYSGAVNSPLGDHWTKMRKMMAAELFSPAVHRLFYDKRKEEHDNIVEYMYKQPNGIVDIRKTALCYATNIIKKLMFNTRYFGEAMADKGPGPAEEEHANSILTALAFIFAFTPSDFFPWMTGTDLDGKEKKASDAIKNIEKYHDPIIDQRIRKWRGKQQQPKDDHDTNACCKEDMLDIMINLNDTDGKPLLSENEIKGLVNELVLGATDNAANAVEWSMAEMLNNRSIMQKAMEELDTVVGKERLVQESDIPELKYIKSILMESFRLHPIQAFVPPHYSVQDATVAGYFIPKGSHILISRLDLGRNPDAWDEPLTFNPDRHMKSGACDRSVITDPDLGFVSFGIGRRACAALALGTSMTVMLLARILQAFEWSLVDGMTKVEMKELENFLALMAKPLVAKATPRLPPHLYRFA